MSENNETMLLEGFTPEWFAATHANDGGSFTRHPHGDYRLRVADFKIEASKGAKPHNMMVVTLDTIAVIDGDKAAIGMAQTVRYGTAQSPKFMQERAKCFLTAIGVASRFSPKSVIGRELDATVSLERGSPTIGLDGNPKVFINSRVSFERRAGSPKPPKANAKAMSADALRYLESQDSDEIPAGGGNGASPAAPAWEDPPAAAVEETTSTEPAESAERTADKDHFIDEADVPASAHPYRVYIAMGGTKAEKARDVLLAKQIDPDGEISLDHVSEPLRSEYMSWKAKAETKPIDDLPPIDDDPPVERPKAKTGTRSKR